MPLSTLETLPNEILMMIFQYSGDTLQVFRTFLGLNERFNHILLDRQLHLLTDYSSLKPLDEYYNSDEFQQARRQLLTIKTSITEEKFGKIFRPLVAYGIRQRYLYVKDKFRLSRARFESIRQQLGIDERRKIDQDIKDLYDRIPYSFEREKIGKNLIELVLIQGARLEYDNDELSYFNLAKFIRYWISASIDGIRSNLNLPLKFYLKVVQTLFISNPDLLDNRYPIDYSDGREVEYFLLHSLFSLRGYNDQGTSDVVNIQYFRAILDLYFLTLHCRSATLDSEANLVCNMAAGLNFISIYPTDLYMATGQTEIIKLTVEQCNRETITSDRFKNCVMRSLSSLIKNKRFDMLKDLCDCLNLNKCKIVRVVSEE